MRQFKAGQLQTGSIYNISSSYALTASYALNGGTGVGGGNYIATGSVTASVSLGTGSFTITSGSSTFMFVSSSGNVGFGTGTPAYTLDVVGNTRLTNASAQLIINNSTYSELNYGVNNYFRANGASAIVNGPIIQFLRSGTEVARFATTTGNFLINTTTDAGYKLDVNGTLRVQNVLTVLSSISWGNSRGTLTFTSLDAYMDASQTGGSLIFRTNVNAEVARYTPAQNVLIGTTTDVASSLVTMASTTKGFLPPRTNLTSNISSPAQGLITYVTASATEGLYYYNSGSNIGWHRMLTNSGSQEISGSLNVNNTLYVTGSRVGVGTATPQGAIHIAVSSSTPALVLSDVGAPDTIPTLQFRRGPLSAYSLQIDWPSNLKARFQIGDAVTGYEFTGGPIGLTGGRSIEFGGITGQTATAILGSVHTDNNNGQLLFSTRGSGTLAERMRIFNTGNVGIGTSTDAGFKLDVNGTARIQDTLTVSKNQNAITQINISNTTSGNIAGPILNLTSDVASGIFQFGKQSTTTGTYKTIGQKDGFIYNGTGGDISILNDFSTGLIKFAAGGVSTAQMTLFSTGNFSINTTTDAGFKLDVNGTARVTNLTTSGGVGGIFLNRAGDESFLQFMRDNSVQAQLRTISTGGFRICASAAETEWARFHATGNFAIGSTTDIASAKLNVESTTKGFLPPRTNLTSNISTPAQGLITYVTASATEGLYYYNSGSYQGWTRLLNDSGSQSITGNLTVTGSTQLTALTASGALINGNITVLGTASFVSVTSSIVQVGASTITLNTDNPAVRFGGINVVDSGSFGTSSTGSLLWDSQNNRWIYSNPSGSTYDGGLLISGPRNTSGLGNEEGTTLNALMKGQGGDHITSSGVFEVSGSVGIGTSSPTNTLDVTGSVRFRGSATIGGSIYPSTAWPNYLTIGNDGTDKIITGYLSSSTNGAVIGAHTSALNAWSNLNVVGSNIVFRRLGEVEAMRVNSSSNVLIGTPTDTGHRFVSIGAGTSGSVNLDSTLYVSASRVGIGITNPASLLHLSGTPGSVANSGIYFSGNTAIWQQASSTLTIRPSGTDISTFTTTGVGIGTSGPTSRLHIQGSGATSATTALRVENTNASASLVVLDNGFVGIGTTTPSNKLDVVGDIEFGTANVSDTWRPVLGVSNLVYPQPFLSVANADPSMARFNIALKTDTIPDAANTVTGFTGPQINLWNSGVSKFLAINTNGLQVSNGTSLSLQPNSGNVGIGTITPSASLHISGASSAALLEIDSPAVNNILFVSGSGNVGIGTNTPFQKLYVDGDIGLKAGNFLNLAGDQGTSISAGFQASFATYHKVIVYTNNQAIGTFSRDNGWGIGFSSTPSARLQVRGSGATSSTTALLVENSNASASFTVFDNGNVSVNGGLTFTGGANTAVIATSAANYSTARIGQIGGYDFQYGAFNSGQTVVGYHTGLGLNGLTTVGGTSLYIWNRSSPAQAIIFGGQNSAEVFRIANTGRVGFGTTTPLANVDVAGTTRISGSFNTATSGSILTVIGSGSAQPIFTVQGSQGELFSITDSLSGSLFSVNDISGLPILEVFSDNTTLIGNYQDPMLITTAKVVQTNSGSFTMYSLPTASYDTAFFEYSVRSGSNARAGSIMAMQLGTTVNFTETTTTDFGSTSAVSFTVIVTGSNMALTGSSTSGAWTIKTIVRGI